MTDAQNEHSHINKMTNVSILASLYAVLDGPGGSPVEHACAVILHLRGNKVKVPGLDTIHCYPGAELISSPISAPGHLRCPHQTSHRDG